MKKEIADKWADKLESGEYKQGTGCLRECDNYCCLGVLSDIVKKELNTEWIKSTSVYHPDRYSIKGERDFLPEEVKEYCEMKSCNPTVVVSDKDDMYYFTDEGYGLLSELNDKHIPFTKIAQLIRENYETI